MSMITSPAKSKTVAEERSTSHGAVELCMGEQVLALLDDAGFVEDWNELYRVCPWATVFQSSAYVATWYRIFAKEFLPILIKTRHAGKLTGLLALAKHKNGLITGAGASLAEYQAWLTADPNDETFIKKAFLEMDRNFPGKKIIFKYMPAGIPLGFTKNDRRWKKRCMVKTFRHPLMIINDQQLTRELKKKNRKEKLNRLKRLGELKFERVLDYREFASIFDELALQSDLRKGALYNKIPFKTEPLRKKFYLALFAQGELHATVLKVNNKIIASNVGVSGTNVLHLQGINTFDASFAKYSPGILHFLLLGKLLAEEGVEVFDLTPGGDPYKDTLATDYTVAYTLAVGNRHYAFTNRLKAGLNRFFARTAGIAGITPDALKKRKRNAQVYKIKCTNAARQGFRSLYSFLFKKAKSGSSATKCWTGEKIDKATASGLLNVQKNNLADLLDFDKREIRFTLQEFLENAMLRLEGGAHCYSWAEGGVLLACIWSRKTDTVFTSLSGLYCHPKAGKNVSAFLRSVVAELSAGTCHEKLYIASDCHGSGLFEAAGLKAIAVADQD